MSIWWLSFAKEDGHAGCCMVEAPEFLMAVMQSHVLGCNPGGECQGIELPDGPEVRAEVDKWGLGKLITKQMMLEAGGEPLRL